MWGMIDPCPNTNCPNFQKNNSVIKDGNYFRKDDSRTIHRFKCKICLKRFSSSTKTLEFRQKKRRINFQIYQLLASSISQRRSALIMNVDRKTIGRKLIYLAEKARRENAQFLELLQNTPVMHMQFDDLITSVHSKLRPVSVSVAIDKLSRKILGFEVAVIPAFGHLAAISRRKYGKRKSEHLEKLHALFGKISAVVSAEAIIESDEHKLYPLMIERYFPRSKYKQYKGARGAVVGQGELKKKRYDPLFMINHTLACFRANINRLVRRTWCTSKDIDRLRDHIDIFVHFYNHELI